MPLTPEIDNFILKEMLNLELLEVEPHQMVRLKQYWIWFLLDSMQLLFFLPLKQQEVCQLLQLYSLKVLGKYFNWNTNILGLEMKILI